MLASSKSGTNPTGVLTETITDLRKQHAGWEWELAAAVYFHKVIITRPLLYEVEFVTDDEP